MITFFVLLVALVSLLIIAGLVIIAGGAGIFLALADLIVCGLIIYGIVRLVTQG